MITSKGQSFSHRKHKPSSRKTHQRYTTIDLATGLSRKSELVSFVGSRPPYNPWIVPIINSKVESKNPDPQMDITQNSTPDLTCPSSPGGSTTSPYVPISPMEAKHYYHGLCSRPILVARSGTDTWNPPAGPVADLPCKELRPISSHPIRAV
ncbi:unnamed protein product [Tuber aestivum]|uniref:Uncharacterized protein n=1 Tax=Tuber aestivum TaxID=59557 RepID=A0A292Q3H3_9PEZI|nr:unnamed protein product [Tuber aestivum]